MFRVRINAHPSDPLTGPEAGQHVKLLCIRRLGSCPEIQSMNEQKEGRDNEVERKDLSSSVALVIASAMAAPAAIGPAATVIAPAAPATVIMAAAIIPATAV